MTGLCTQPGTGGLHVASFWHRNPGITPLCSLYRRKGASYPSEFAQRAPRRMIMRRKARLEPQSGLLGAKNRPFGPILDLIRPFARLRRSKSACTITLWVASILHAAVFDATPIAPDWGQSPFRTQNPFIIMEAVMINRSQSTPYAALRKQFLELSEGGLTEDMDPSLSYKDEYKTLAGKFFRMLLDDEVEELCGRRYERLKQEDTCYMRHGSNKGSVYLGGEKVPIKVPRVRDVKNNEEKPLEMYRRYRRPSEREQEKLLTSVVLGISQRDYSRAVTGVAKSFGLSASTVSRRFQARAEKAFNAYAERDLSSETYVALQIDGKYLKEHQVVICVGITNEGKKQILGSIETSTENAEAVKGLLEGLIARGLDFSKGILVVIDGAKGIHKAVKETFEEKAQVQRCTWHKQENVLSYLKEEDKDRVKHKMQEAYKKGTYGEAKEALKALHEELLPHNRRAANSLAEGMEETLTLHRLGVARELGGSLQTTNIIENANGLIGQRIGKIKRWTNTKQLHRWLLLALMEAERRFKELPCKDDLPKLQKALLEAIPNQ